MKPEEFCIWLRGFLDGADTPNGLPTEKLEQLSAKLDSVFSHAIDQESAKKKLQEDVQSRLRKAVDEFVRGTKPWEPMPEPKPDKWVYERPGPDVVMGK